MKQQLFFLHSGGPQGPHEGSNDFVAWLNLQLAHDYEIIHPVMLHPEAPDYQAWKPRLQEELARLRDGVLLIGHSLGGSLLLKYLAEESISFSMDGLFLIGAPYWGGDDNWQHPPFNLPADFPATLPNIAHIFLYQSQDDPIVSSTHLGLYAKAMPQAIARMLIGSDHFFASGLPELANDLKSVSE